MALPPVRQATMHTSHTLTPSATCCSQIKMVSSFEVAPEAVGGHGEADHAVVNQLKRWSIGGSFLADTDTTDAAMFVVAAATAADCANAAAAAPLNNGDAYGHAAERYVTADGLLTVEFAAGAATASGSDAALRLCYKHGSEPYMVYSR